MTDQWTPTTADIRGIIAWRHAAYRDRLTVETFDRWLAEVSATVLEEAADALVKLTPYGMELLPDGREDKQAAAYVEGVHTSHDFSPRPRRTNPRGRTSMTIEDEAQAADEREALARVISYKGYPSIGDYEEDDAILAAGFHRHLQPTEGGLEEASRLMYEDEREWYGTAKWPHWDDADEMTRREMRRAMRAALRAARVADQEGENR